MLSGVVGKGFAARFSGGSRKGRSLRFLQQLAPRYVLVGRTSPKVFNGGGLDFGNNEFANPTSQPFNLTALQPSNPTTSERYPDADDGAAVSLVEKRTDYFGTQA